MLLADVHVSVAGIAAIGTVVDCKTGIAGIVAGLVAVIKADIAGKAADLATIVAGVAGIAAVIVNGMILYHLECR